MDGVFQPAGTRAGLPVDCKFQTEAGLFNYRVAGVFIHEGKLLAMKESNITHYYLPGGRVRMQETLEEALAREMMEELGVGAKAVRPLWMCESFFTLGMGPVHEIALFFLAELDWDRLPSLTGTFTRTDTDGDEHIFTWLEPEEVRGAAIYPLVLKESYPRLPEHLTLVTDTRDRP